MTRVGKDEIDDNEKIKYVCGLSSYRPEPNSINFLMLDSGSQSNACRKEFAPQCDVDDSEKAKFWDIQDTTIRSHGKNIVDITMHGDRDRTFNQIKMDVSDIGKDVLAMGRLLRSGYDLHFTDRGHKC